VTPDQEFEIQILDEEGKAAKTIHLSRDDIGRSLAVLDVPNAVVEAVRNLPSANSLYVNELGQLISGF
jgi:hypothetical protein